MIKIKHTLLTSAASTALLFGSVASGAAIAGPVGYASLNGGTTGGEGGQVVYASTGSEINQAMCNRATDDTPLIIMVDGTINHGNTQKFSGSCDTQDDAIQFKGVSNISLIGVGNNALLDEMGIHLRDTSNIVIRNLHIRNVKKSGSPTSNGGDAIGMESGVSNVWVDHCELEASGGEDDGYDSLIDMKANTKYVTVSYNYLHDSGRGGLMGSSDSDDENTFVTFHHNYYENIDSRLPLLRHGTAHAFNNYYDGINKSGMNPRIGGRIKAENNHFVNAKNPIGTFYTDDMGYWDLSNNKFDSVVWEQSDSDDWYPAGPSLTSTTSIDIPYSYTLDDVECVYSVLSATVGTGTGLAESDGSCGTSSSSSTSSTSSTSSSTGSSTTSSSTSGSTTSGSSTSGSTSSSSTGGSTSSTSSTSSSGGYDLGANLSIGAGSDGSSKGAGSYGNVRDGDMDSYWSPSGNTGRISIKWSSDTTVNAVNIREAAGTEGTIGAWQLINNDNGALVASGSGAGEIHFDAVTLPKLNFEIISANGTPQVAEFETYFATGSSSTSSSTGSTTTSSGSTSSSSSTTSSSSTGGSVELFSSTNDDTVYLNWNVANIDVTGQQVYRDIDSDPAGRVRIANGVTGTSYTDTLTESGTYYYWVKLTTADGTVYNSNAASASYISYQPVTAVFEESQAGYCGVDGAIETEHTGYTGSGYSNTTNESGTSVDYAIYAPQAGVYEMTVVFANGSSSRPGDVVVNNAYQGTFDLDGTGAWNAYATSNTLYVSLDAGNNLVTIEASGSSGLANIDSLSVTGTAPAAGDCVGGSSTSSSSSTTSSTSSSGGSTTTSSSSSSSTTSSTSSGGSTSSSSSGSTSSSGGNATCEQLVNDNSVNWNESALGSEQEIVQCLSDTLGKPVGFGENATGGFDPSGGSNLVVIKKNTGVSVEQQILDAISTNDHNWIVFDKDDFANRTAVAMYRLECDSSDVQSALGGASEALCLDHLAWCAANGISDEHDCENEFFNNRLNDKDLPIRNTMIMSNTTIDGRGANAYFFFNGFKIGADSSGASTFMSENVIVTNNEFVGAGHTEDHDLDPDMIRSTGESHDIWIHQNTFDTTGDSAFDVKVGAYDITVSFNKLVNVKRAALHGSSDSRTINEQITTTMHNNLFFTSDDQYALSTYNTLRRVPLMRRGQSHMFNNVFYGYRKDILSVRKGGRIAFEDNIIINKESASDPGEGLKDGDDLEYYVESLLRDFREGGLEISGSYATFADTACNTQGGVGDLTASHGSTPDMYASYNSASKNTISNNRFIAGDDLIDYVFATAGKGGKTPYVSAYSAGQNALISQANPLCQ